MRSNLQKNSGVTIVELTVVLLIMSILSSIAATVYVGYISRARYASARADIQALELAITRYQVDLGAYPISSSSPTVLTDPDPITPATGCGYLMLCLLHSASGDATKPASPRWQGPYITLQQNRLGDLTGQPITAATPLAQHCLLDPWGRPYTYVRNDDYAALNATITSPTLAEKYYNPTTFQIYSNGANGYTLGTSAQGLESDDVNNFYNR